MKLFRQSDEDTKKRIERLEAKAQFIHSEMIMSDGLETWYWISILEGYQTAIDKLKQ